MYLLCQTFDDCGREIYFSYGEGVFRECVNRPRAFTLNLLNPVRDQINHLLQQILKPNCIKLKFYNHYKSKILEMQCNFKTLKLSIKEPSYFFVFEAVMLDKKRISLFIFFDSVHVSMLIFFHSHMKSEMVNWWI